MILTYGLDSFSGVRSCQLFDSIDTGTVVGLRDKVVLGTLASTGIRVGAIAKLKVEDLKFDGTQYVLHVMEKRGKIRKIPVRHELEKWLIQYMDTAKLGLEPKDWPIFRTAIRKTGQLTPYSPADPKNGQPRAKGVMTPNDMHRMLKRRLKDAGLPTVYSCHSFRVCVATDLLQQEGVKGKDVQYLLGHKDRRTTDIYDRTPDVVTRNLVERISI